MILSLVLTTGSFLQIVKTKYFYYCLLDNMYEEIYNRKKHNAVYLIINITLNEIGALQVDVIDFM